jgi:hypothetical protein
MEQLAQQERRDLRVSRVLQDHKGLQVLTEQMERQVLTAQPEQTAFLVGTSMVTVDAMLPQKTLMPTQYATHWIARAPLAPMAHRV